MHEMVDTMQFNQQDGVTIVMSSAGNVAADIAVATAQEGHLEMKPSLD